MDPTVVDLVGFAASGFVFLTFYMKTLLPLRIVAILSNVLFITYGLIAGLVPILVLHLLLFPLNSWRALQQLKARRQMRHILDSEPSVDVLMPLMVQQKCKDGDTIFRRGGKADRLYLVIEGEVLVEDFDKIVSPGEIFGEVGLFTPDATRTATVASKGPSTLAWVDREMILKVFQDHPGFALGLTKLITTRLSANQADLMRRLQDG